MNRYISIALALAAFVGVAPSQGHAQTSFFLGLGAGMMMMSNGNGGGPSAGGDNTMYLLPRAAERIKDPLLLQTVISTYYCNTTPTIGEAFKKTLGDKVYGVTLVHVLRVPAEPDLSCIRYWFTATVNNNVVPLDQLPKPPQ